MTPEQLARLETLLAKSELTASENQELTFLKSLAASGAPIQASAGGNADDDEEEDKDLDDDVDEDDDDEKTEQSAKPGILAQARALATPKSALVKRNSELTAQVGRLTAEKAQLSQTIAANAQTIAGLQTDLAAANEEIAELKAKAKTVSQELAGLGVKDGDLPAPNKAEKGGTYNSEAEVAAAIEAAATWEEKQAIMEAWEKQAA